MIKILIADDEKHALERLKNLLLEYNLFTIVNEAKNGNEVIEILINSEIDVAFLDINMPGVSVFKSISSLKNPPLIIFQTAYAEYAVNAFGINALDYLMKPVTRERLNTTVMKIKNALPVTADSSENSEPPSDQLKLLSVKSEGKIKVIAVETVYKIVFEEGFCFIYTDENRFLADRYLNYYEKNLKSCGFFRASRTALVNINYIKVLHPMFKGNYSIELSNQTRIKLSRRRAQSLKRLIGL